MSEPALPPTAPQVRGQLTKLERATLGALVVMDVHARDVVTVLAAEDVKIVSDFSWQCQVTPWPLPGFPTGFDSKAIWFGVYKRAPLL
jgi:hypothetical protein